ncbi:Caspase-7 [Orchesella cincta]|uniref:Caspase-7 n=1 Tax=Orchesella cincta TaxID=48709 RepID=A0A1D2MF06_ORCCI|nr:Caspase-7 [Orchesella cincta]
MFLKTVKRNLEGQEAQSDYNCRKKLNGFPILIGALIKVDQLALAKILIEEANKVGKGNGLPQLPPEADELSSSTTDAACTQPEPVWLPKDMKNFVENELELDVHVKQPDNVQSAPPDANDMYSLPPDEDMLSFSTSLKYKRTGTTSGSRKRYKIHGFSEVQKRVAKIFINQSCQIEGPIDNVTNNDPPDWDDTIFIKAQMPKYPASRGPVCGSYFVIVLVYVLMNKARDTSLMKMLEEVQKYMKIISEELPPEDNQMSPFTISGLKKGFYFFTKR